MRDFTFKLYMIKPDASNEVPYHRVITLFSNAITCNSETSDVVQIADQLDLDTLLKQIDASANHINSDVYYFSRFLATLPFAILRQGLINIHTTNYLKPRSIIGLKAIDHFLRGPACHQPARYSSWKKFFSMLAYEKQLAFYQELIDGEHNISNLVYSHMTSSELEECAIYHAYLHPNAKLPILLQNPKYALRFYTHYKVSPWRQYIREATQLDGFRNVPIEHPYHHAILAVLPERYRKTILQGGDYSHNPFTYTQPSSAEVFTHLDTSQQTQIAIAAFLKLDFYTLNTLRESWDNNNEQHALFEELSATLQSMGMKHIQPMIHSQLSMDDHEQEKIAKDVVSVIADGHRSYWLDPQMKATAKNRNMTNPITPANNPTVDLQPDINESLHPPALSFYQYFVSSPNKHTSESIIPTEALTLRLVNKALAESYWTKHYQQRRANVELAIKLSLDVHDILEREVELLRTLLTDDDPHSWQRFIEPKFIIACTCFTVLAVGLLALLSSSIACMVPDKYNIPFNTNASDEINSPVIGHIIPDTNYSVYFSYRGREFYYGPCESNPCTPCSIFTDGSWEDIQNAVIADDRNNTYVQIPHVCFNGSEVSQILVKPDSRVLTDWSNWLTPNVTLSSSCKFFFDKVNRDCSGNFQRTPNCISSTLVSNPTRFIRTHMKSLPNGIVAGYNCFAAYIHEPAYCYLNRIMDLSYGAVGYAIANVRGYMYNSRMFVRLLTMTVTDCALICALVFAMSSIAKKLLCHAMKVPVSSAHMKRIRTIFANIHEISDVLGDHVTLYDYHGARYNSRELQRKSDKELYDMWSKSSDTRIARFVPHTPSNITEAYLRRHVFFKSSHERVESAIRKLSEIRSKYEENEMDISPTNDSYEMVPLIRGVASP